MEELAALQHAQAHAQEAHLSQMLETLRAEQAAIKSRAVQCHELGGRENSGRFFGDGGEARGNAGFERGFERESAGLERGQPRPQEENEIQSMLRAMRAEQAALKDRFSSQESTIMKLQREVEAAARERDEAKQQVEHLRRGGYRFYFRETPGYRFYSGSVTAWNFCCLVGGEEYAQCDMEQVTRSRCS